MSLFNSSDYIPGPPVNSNCEALEVNSRNDDLIINLLWAGHVQQSSTGRLNANNGSISGKTIFTTRHALMYN